MNEKVIYTIKVKDWWITILVIIVLLILASRFQDGAIFKDRKKAITSGVILDDPSVFPREGEGGLSKQVSEKSLLVCSSIKYG